MKKILILVPNLNQTGGVASIYKALNLEEDKRIKYFTVNQVKQQAIFAALFRLIARYWTFFFKVIRGGYKVIHVNPSLTPRSFYRDSGFIIISRILHRKTLVFFHGWQEAFEKKIKKSKLKTFLFRISYAKVDKYIVLSDIFKSKLYELGVPSKTIFFIGSTVADSSYLKEFDLKRKFGTYRSKLNLLFLSRIEKEKGVYIAIDAFKFFLEQHPETNPSLIIAGDGSELVAAKKYVEDIKIPFINFLGNVSGDMKKKTLLDSHIMLFPTYYSEGLPNSILEGMLYGMPVISRPVGGISDVVHQKENGYLSESLEPRIFADFLSLLVSDIDLYEKIAKENHLVALEKFTSEKVRDRIIEIYKGFN